MTSQVQPRTPNVALRIARQSMRLSQTEFALAVRSTGNAIGIPNRCTKRLVQKWENGEHIVCSRKYLEVLEAVTGLSARELGFLKLPDGTGRPTRLREADHAPGTAAPTVQSSDAMIDGSTHRLHHAINHPASVDSRTLVIVEAATARLFDIERHSPARLLAAAVDRHLATVTMQLTAARHEPVRRRFINEAGRTALLAGWLAFDCRHKTEADDFWTDAISAAEATMDSGLLAATLCFQSYAAFRHGDPGSAWQLAHDATQHTPDDPRATAWASARAALYAAQLGEREHAERAMERALEIGEDLENPKPGDGTPPWLRSIDNARLLSTIAHTAAVLKYPDAADFATQAADALTATHTKSRAIVLAEATLTAAMADEPKLCADWGSEAATLAFELRVSLAIDLLTQAVPILRPLSGTTAVSKLLPLLTQLTDTANAEQDANQQEPPPAPTSAPPSEPDESHSPQPDATA